MYKDVLNKGFLIRICYIKPMIIICPSCQKKFDLDENLISNKGRLLKCGSCGETWFFKRENNIEIENTEIEIENTEIEKDFENHSNEISKSLKPNKKKVFDYKQSISNLPNIKGSELVKYKKKNIFTIGKFFSYLIVFIITFIAIVIVLDTFKSPLSVFFPNLEFVLYNLFETLRDLILFAKDLN